MASQRHWRNRRQPEDAADLTLNDERLAGIVRLHVVDTDANMPGLPLSNPETQVQSAVVEPLLPDLFCVFGILLLVPILYLFGLIARTTAWPTLVLVAAFMVGLVLLREGQRASRGIVSRIAFYLAGFMFICEWIIVFSLLLRRIV